MKFNVYLSKTIRRHDGKDAHCEGEWVKRVALPIPPFVGLEVSTRDVDRAEEITHIWITPRGVCVCHFKDDVWIVKDDDGYDVTPADWPKTLAYETEGWTRVEDYDDLLPEND
jgi:hypothetical protein